MQLEVRLQQLLPLDIRKRQYIAQENARETFDTVDARSCRVIGKRAVRSGHNRCVAGHALHDGRDPLFLLNPMGTCASL